MLAPPVPRAPKKIHPRPRRCYGPLMVKNDEVDEILRQTLEDERLSRSEKQALTALFGDHSDDPQRLAFFRHRAFEIARRELQGQRAGRVVTWLEDVVKALAVAAEPEAAPRLAEAHFSPGDHCRRRIVSLIKQARRSAEICVFTITDNTIARALLEAHDRATPGDDVDDRMKLIGVVQLGRQAPISRLWTHRNLKKVCRRRADPSIRHRQR